ncbi:CBF5 [Symbiodinium natans]|uniref:CBF5 protein n=1 Tax=Symbiodinium natans TaxID=878477 RepID=A0A812H101_9DINO|nr:CBF5 [Symbiodinium natans]
MEEQKLSSFMESMDISTKDIWTLFMLIDADESGEISIDEFVSGCMQLQGPAKSIQLARVRHENNLMRRDIRNVLDEVKAVKKSLRSAEPKRKSKASDEDANLATL